LSLLNFLKAFCSIAHCPHSLNGRAHFKNVSQCLSSNIYSYLETFGDQSSMLYWNVVHFSTPRLIRHLWQLKTVIFLHWCVMHAALLTMTGFGTLTNWCYHHVLTKWRLTNWLSVKWRGAQNSLIQLNPNLGHKYSVRRDMS